MARDVSLTVAAATMSPDISIAAEKPSFAVEVDVPKLEVEAGPRTAVAIDVIGEAL